jgi:8-oxo-dGTP pyrophosphatase MutT (NUDIX family)
MAGKVELVDLVDHNGNVVRTRVPRHEEVVPADGLHMQIVVVVLFNPLGHVLVQQRAFHKSSGGNLDFICGAVISGETPTGAAIRETQEESGLTGIPLNLVRKGVNEYGRYCYLFTGETAQPPGQPDPDETVWVEFRLPKDLIALHDGELIGFVSGFFEDLAAAQAARRG